MNRLLLLLAITLLASCTTQPNQVADVQADPQAVHDVLQSYLKGRQARDIEAVEAVLHPDVDQLTSRGEWRRGREASTAGMKRSSAKNPGERTLSVESLRFLRPDVALADARYVIKGTNGPDRILWSSFTLVRDEEGGWKITSIRN